MSGSRKRHRGNGEGGIRQRSDGRWEAVVTVGWEGGKQRRRYYTGKTREAVERRLTAARADMDRGRVLVDERVTVNRLFDDWLSSMEKRGRKRSTIYAHRKRAKLHIRPLLGAVQVAKLTPRVVEQLMDLKLEEGLSPQTVRQIRSTLSAALSQAERWELVNRNVAQLTSPPTAPRFAAKPMTREELALYREAVKGHRYEAALLLLTLGLRAGETLAARWEDLDIPGGVLSVTGTLTRLPDDEGKWRVVREDTPKTRRSRRRVTLPPSVGALLKAWRPVQSQERLRLGPDWEGGELVFTTKNGTPVHRGVLRNHFHKVLKSAGVEKRRMHDMRHTAATLLLRDGADAKTVSEWLGHSSVSITLDLYGHVLPDRKQEVAARLAGFLELP